MEDTGKAKTPDAELPDLPLPPETTDVAVANRKGRKVDITDDGGLSKKIVRLGSGPTPKKGDKLTVHYTGTLEDGTKFDSSRDRAQPFDFKVGVGQVIKGWDQGMVTMQRGERSIFTIREDYGYGKSGSGSTIPPGATLVFDVEMIDFESPEPLPHELSVAERIEKANELKAEGNRFFGAKDYTRAFARYQKALKFTDADSSDEEDEATGDKTNELSAIALSCNLNSAQAKISMKEYKVAITFCDSVLESEAGKENLKALYRRAVAQAGLGNNKAAFKDLAAALKIAPNDKSIKKKIKSIRKKVQAQKKKEKKAFSGMFKKLGGMYGDKNGDKKDTAAADAITPDEGHHHHHHADGTSCGHDHHHHEAPAEATGDGGDGSPDGGKPSAEHEAPAEATGDGGDGSPDEGKPSA